MRLHSLWLRRLAQQRASQYQAKSAAKLAHPLLNSAMSGSPRTLEVSRSLLCALETSRQLSAQLPGPSRLDRPLTSLSSLCACERSHIKVATSFLSQG